MGEVTKLKGGQLLFPEIREAAKAQHLPEDFEWFWREYPRREAKGDAFKAWRQMQSIRPPIEELIAAVKKYAESVRYREKDKIRLPATYLRGWGWMDE